MTVMRERGWGWLVLCVALAGALTSVARADIDPPGRRVPVLAYVSNQAEFPDYAFIARDAGPWGTRYYRVEPTTRLGIFYKMHALTIMAVRKTFLADPKNKMLVSLLDGEGSLNSSDEAVPQEPSPVSPPPPAPAPGKSGRGPVGPPSTRIGPGGNENDSGLPGVPVLQYPGSSRGPGDYDRGGERGYFELTRNKPGFYCCEDEIHFHDSYTEDDADKASAIAREFKIAGFDGEKLRIYMARQVVGYADGKVPQIKEFPNPWPGLPKEAPEQTWLYKTLHDAARYGNLDEVKRFIASGTSVNDLDRAGRNPLHWAAENGHNEVVALLIEKGAKTDVTDAFNDTPLTAATKKGHAETVALLQKSGVKLSGSDGLDALIAAIEKGDEKLAKSLIDGGVDVKGANRHNSDTPLHVAARRDRRGITGYMVKQGADVNAVNDQGETPLFGTIRYQYRDELVEMAKFLLAKGAKLEIYDRFGVSPLIRAVQTRAKALVKLFVEKGADPNRPDSRGKTPLAFAPDDEMRALLKSLGAK